MVLTSMMSVMAETGNPGETAPGTETGAVQEELKTDDSTATDSKAEGEEGSTDAVKNEDDAIAEDKASPSAESEEAVAMAPKRLTNKNMMLGTPPNPDTKITSTMDISSAEIWTNNFTVGENGLVRSRVNALTIEGSVISNQAVNTAGYNKNTAFIAHDQGPGVVIINGAKINNAPGEHDLVTAVKGAKFEIKNSTVNFADGSTGAPYIWSYNGSQDCTIEGTTFKGAGGNNGVILRAGGSNKGDSGSEAKLTLAGSNTFDTVNGSFRALGTIEVTGTTTIKDSTIEIKDGPIYVRNGATLNITNSGITQTYNTNTAGIIVEPGGTLNISGSDLVDTWISNEGTVNEGTVNNKGTVNITGTESDKSDLNNCVIKNLNSTLNISYSTLHNCNRKTAPNTEGGFDTMIHGTGATITLTNTEICNNTNTYETPSPEAVPGASIISVKDGSVTMDNVYAHDNVVSTNGGVMHAVDAEVTVRNNSRFTNNSANNNGWQTDNWYGKGGALFIEDDHINPTPHKTIINNTTFEGNKATEGGAVFIKSDNTDFRKSMIYMTDSTFTKNEAPRAGGGLVIWGNGTTAELRGVEFNENTAGNFGGGMAVFFDMDPNGTLITASDNGPSKFVGNTVTKGKNFAGGGLFIDQAHVTMEDTAIYNNTAPHAGGGLSTCGVGTLEARVHDGVAIYDNNVRGKHGSLPDGYTLKDVYLRNINNNAILPGDKKDFPDYPYELYERMFNGGLHKWDKKEIQDEGYLQLVAKSDATNKDVSKAKVVFTENEVTATGNEVVSGGGIACNGLLTIGRGTELKAVKIWDDNNNNDGYRPDPDEIDWIKIKADGKEIDLKEYNVEFTVVKGTEADDYVLDNNIAVIDEDGKVTKFSEKYKDLGDNAWLIIIDGDFPRYRDVEKEGGGITHKLINYTAEEDLGKLGSKYSNTKREGGMDSYFELTNSHVDETVEVAGQKTWDDNNNQRGDRPESITVTLFKNGVQVPDAVKTIGESNNWKWDFGEFPKFENGEKISYTVVENAVSDYSVSYNDFNVTNKYTPGMTSVTVVKNWEDKDDADGIRPSSVTVKLLANGKDTGKTLVLSKSNNWIGAFTDLYEKENGKAIVYTVSETAVKGYTSSVSGDQKTGYVITNKHNPKKNGAGSGSSKKGVRTGDANNVLPWIITLAAAAAILGAVIAKRRLNK